MVVWAREIHGGFSWWWALGVRKTLSRFGRIEVGERERHTGFLRIKEGPSFCITLVAFINCLFVPFLLPRPDKYHPPRPVVFACAKAREKEDKSPYKEDAGGAFPPTLKLPAGKLPSMMGSNSSPTKDRGGRTDPLLNRAYHSSSNLFSSKPTVDPLFVEADR